ncbi:MAG: aminotransferase class I/II-fold pyridoxal phosphate-dependent enzyme [Actinobacteria bacterium]|nr:aminotransferase class I/II-fold pyridoxal phosphate-dependent enzyme [Actinomycetota bacterium]
MNHSEVMEADWEAVGPLRDPVLVIALRGWFDVAGVATGALEWCIQERSVTVVASIDPENVSNVAQMAALEAVSGDLSAVAMMRESFARRGTLMHKLLSEIPGITCMEPQGAFYCFPNVKGLLGKNLSGSTASTTLELADLVLDKAKVAFVPGEAFGAPGFARFSFALGDDDLRQGIEQLASFVRG